MGRSRPGPPRWRPRPGGGKEGERGRGSSQSTTREVGLEASLPAAPESAVPPPRAARVEHPHRQLGAPAPCPQRVVDAPRWRRGRPEGAAGVLDVDAPALQVPVELPPGWARRRRARGGAQALEGPARGPPRAGAPPPRAQGPREWGAVASPRRAAPGGPRGARRCGGPTSEKRRAAWAHAGAPSAASRSISRVASLAAQALLGEDAGHGEAVAREGGPFGERGSCRSERLAGGEHAPVPPAQQPVACPPGPRGGRAGAAHARHSPRGRGASPTPRR